MEDDGAVPSPSDRAARPPRADASERAAGALGRRGPALAARDRIRTAPGGHHLVRAVVFAIGLFFVLVGVALSALPGPLTIPPVLLGVWIWAWEFHWAERLFQRARRSADDAWATARRRPLASALVTGGGLAAFGVGLWLVARYELVDRARTAVGL